MQIYLQFCSRKDPNQGLMSENIEYLNFFLKPSMASWPQNICTKSAQGHMGRPEHGEKFGRFLLSLPLPVALFSSQQQFLFPRLNRQAWLTHGCAGVACRFAKWRVLILRGWEYRAGRTAPTKHRHVPVWVDCAGAPTELSKGYETVLLIGWT